MAIQNDQDLLMEKEIYELDLLEIEIEIVNQVTPWRTAIMKIAKLIN